MGKKVCVTNQTNVCKVGLHSLAGLKEIYFTAPEICQLISAHQSRPKKKLVCLEMTYLHNLSLAQARVLATI